MHFKKRLAIFPPQAGMSLTKLFNLNYFQPGRGWQLTSRLGTGKSLTLFYSVTLSFIFCLVDKMALSACLVQVQVSNWQCRTVDERNIMVLSDCRCRLQVCDIWYTFTFTISIRRGFRGRGPGEVNWLTSWSALFFNFPLLAVGCWASCVNVVLIVCCICWWLMFVVDYRVFQLVVKCWIWIVESCCQWFLVIRCHW